MIEKELDLTDVETDEIKKLNARIVVVKNLLQETKDNDYLYDKLITDLAETQQKYDDWFIRMQTSKNVKTTPNNSWNVDFEGKKLQLLMN